MIRACGLSYMCLNNTIFINKVFDHYPSNFVTDYQLFIFSLLACEKLILWYDSNIYIF